MHLLKFVNMPVVAIPNLLCIASQFLFVSSRVFYASVFAQKTLLIKSKVSEGMEFAPLRLFGSKFRKLDRQVAKMRCTLLFRWGTPSRINEETHLCRKHVCVVDRLHRSSWSP